MNAEAIIAQLRKELEAERTARQAAEAELEKLKKGSIDMMKYVTNLQRKKHDEELEQLRQELKTARAHAKESEKRLQRK